MQIVIIAVLAILERSLSQSNGETSDTEDDKANCGGLPYDQKRKCKLCLR